MHKTLLIKMLRDLRINIVQFVAIFVMCFLAMCVVLGLQAGIGGCDVAGERYYRETNFLDIELTADNFTQGDLTTVESLDDVEAASMRSNIVGRIKMPDGERKIGMMFIQDNDVSKMFLMDGKEYAPGDSGIWIDWHFADRYKLSVGQNVTLKYNNLEFTETIRGIMDHPDFMVYTVDDTYTDPAYGEYAYAILDASEFPGKNIKYDRIDVKLKSVKNAFELTDAEKSSIDRAKKELQNTLSIPSLAVIPKSDETGYNTLSLDIEGNTSLMIVFPGLFTGVAILGIVTTMTRMMSRQRTLIGALKALGFSRATITIHYMSYIGVITALACVTGSFVGYHTMARSFIEGMIEWYSNPYFELTVPDMAIICNVGLIIISLLTAYLSSHSLLVQNAADILRPEAPANARAGITERLFIWKKMDFATRWNIRDINQNRLRTVSAIVGVMISTSLIYSSFGLNDTNKLNATWKYSEQTPANYTITFKREADYGTVYDYAKQFSGQMIEESEVDLESKTVNRMYGFTVVDDGNLYRFEAPNGKYISLPDYEVGISHKAARTMNVKKGDVLRFRIPGQKRWYKVRIGMIYKTTGLQGISIKRSYLNQLGIEFSPNIVYTNMTVPDSYLERTEIADIGSKSKYLLAIKKRGEHTDSLVYMVMLIALIIGVVVTYNLGMISYLEKIRVIATLKVLGFSTPKIRKILQQQNLIITSMGTVLGLPLGVYVLFVLNDDSDPRLDYVSRTTPGPFILAVIMTLGISILVNSYLSSKVKEIDMVEALKGVE